MKKRTDEYSVYVFLFGIFILPMYLIVGLFKGLYDGFMFWISFFVAQESYNKRDYRMIRINKGFFITLNSPIYKDLEKKLKVEKGR